MASLIIQKYARVYLAKMLLKFKRETKAAIIIQVVSFMSFNYRFYVNRPICEGKYVQFF